MLDEQRARRNAQRLRDYQDRQRQQALSDAQEFRAPPENPQDNLLRERDAGANPDLHSLLDYKA